MRSADLSVLKIDESSRSRRRRTGRLVWGILPATVLLAILVSAFALRSRSPEVELAAAHSASAGSAGGATLLNASGYVTPRRRATVAAKITARVEQIYAEEGMHVKAGQVLAVLDESDYRVRLNSAIADRDSTKANLKDLQVNLANAEIELHRNEELSKSGVTTQQALDNARTAV